PGFDVDLWIGIYAPAGLPPAVLAKLNGEINKVLQHPELKAAFAKIGVTPRGTSPEQAATFTRAEYEKWKKVIVEGQIKPESRTRSAHSGRPCRLDFAHQADFAGRSIGVLVLPAVFLCERIDVRHRAVFRNAPDAATNLDVTVWVVGIDDRKGHGNAFFQVARFDPSLRGVHPNKTILVITPDRRHLRRSIGHDGSQIRKRLLPLQ